MKTRKTILLFLSAVVVLSFLSLFCWCEAHQPTPASDADLRLAMVSMHSTLQTPGISSAVVSFTNGTERQYYVLTADHALAQLAREAACLNQSNLVLGVLSGKDTNSIYKISKPVDEFKIANRRDKKYDLVGLDITGGVEFIAANGGLLSSVNINLSSNADDVIFSISTNHVISGAGVASSADFERLGITPGTEIVCYCAHEINDENRFNDDWKSPIIQFHSKIVAINIEVPIANQPNTQLVHVIEGTVENGNSGGAVYALVEIGKKKYPVLIGIISGKIGGTDKSAVVPVDAFVEFARKNLQK